MRVARPRDSLHDRTALAAAQKKARFCLTSAFLLLIVTAVYLIAEQGRHVWMQAAGNLTNIALALQVATGHELQQSELSLQGIAADLADARATPPQGMRAALRQAMRFDPVSAYLGVVSEGGAAIELVNYNGQPAAADVAQSVRNGLVGAGAALELRPLIRLPHASDWYLPMVMRVSQPVGHRAAFVLALIPSQRLLTGTQALQLVPDSWVTIGTPDGTRLLTYSRGLGRLDVTQPPVPPQILRLLTGSSGSFPALGPDGLHYVVGYSKSASLPFVTAAFVPVSSLYRTWAGRAVAPAILLLLASFAVGVFGSKLQRALRRQEFYVSQLEYLANHDTLTGLMNRDAFTRFLEHAIASAPQAPFAVLVLDLNRFKDINDTLGHSVGDRVLEEVGARLKELMSDESTCIARWGGDELTMFAARPELPQGLDELCAGVHQRLEGTIQVAHVELTLSASIGVALYPYDARIPAELLRRADIAMYSAKAQLRPYLRYASSMDSSTPETLQLRSELARALAEGTLSVVYQPKVRLSDGGLIGLEALARWTHPVLGAVSPGRLVQLAESTELIHPFTQHMLKIVVEQIARWQLAGSAVPVALNISANNLLDQGFIDKLESELEGAGVSAQLLELEVTESAVMRHPETMLTRLEQIRALGVSLAIDDFGTGYTSLSYLKELPVHTLKIDKSFILNLAADTADQRIVKSSIQLAHSFGMTVVAEGVESRAVAQQLVAFGCDYAQGFYFGRPAPAAEIESRWMHTRSRAQGSRG